MTAIRAIHIRGYEERPTPKLHTVYRIEIQAQVRSWQMWRRYSEFYDFHTQLCKDAGSPPPRALPPKRSFSLMRLRVDPQMLEERRSGLEAYLKAIISAKEDNWRESHVLKEFLGVPLSRQNTLTPPSQFTSASWLDEYTELQSRIRDVRADINRRDTLSDRGDVGPAHRTNVNAKTKLAGLCDRVDMLAEGLHALGLSDGERHRRSDMVARLRDDHEKLTQMVSIVRHPAARPVVPVTGPAAAIQVSSPTESDRAALLGSRAEKPITRVFGIGAGIVPKETEETRPLEDHGLLKFQQVQIQRQDEQLSDLTTILRRQKHLGVAISNEIGQQNEILDDLSNEVDRVGSKLSAANRQLNKLR